MSKTIAKLVTEAVLNGDEVLRLAPEPLAGTEIMYVNDGGVLKQTTVQAIATLGLVEINEQTDDYTLVALDAGKLVKMTKGTAVNLTVPPDVFVDGQVVAFQQGGAGTVSFVAGGGVTINSKDSALDMAGQYAAASLLCEGSNTFWLYGGLA